jgi:hypothetical protein
MSEMQAQANGQDGGAQAAAAAATNAGNNQGQNSQQQQNGNGQANGQGNGAANGTLASGAQANGQQQEKPYWPDDWKERMAEHASAGDKKAYDKELRRLQNFDTPFAVYGSYRGMENTWATKQFVKLPGKDGKPEEIAEFHKALGVPEKPEEYLATYKPANGAMLGDDDKPVAAEFAAALHKSGAPPAAVHAALDWYLGNMEKQAAQLDEMDDTFRREAEQALKNDLGHAYQRKTNSIAPLFKTAPGGADVSNPKSLYARVMGGRTADGKIIGNDPDMVRWLISMSQEVNPGASIVEDGDGGIQSIDTQISAIEQRMREDRRGYNKDFAQQEKYRSLLEARNKIQSRQRA